MRQTVLLGLCFLVVGCSRTPAATVVEVTPSEVSETQLPTTLSIRGRGLAQTVALSLDDERPAAVNEPTVALGETAVQVVDHTQPGELQVWVADLPPGSYDLRIGSGAGQTIVRDAFRVVEAGGDVSSGGPTTSNASRDGNADSSVSGDISESAAIDQSSTGDAASSSRASTGEIAIDGGNELTSTAREASSGMGSNDTPAEASTTTNGTSSEEETTLACVASTQLFFDDFESGNFDAWTDYDTTGNCQTSGIDSGESVSGNLAFQANVTCANGNGDHENYSALQFNGDVVRSTYSNSGAGIDAPYGIVIEFWARATFGFDTSDGEWLAFLVLSGACDWSDTVFSVGTGNATSYLAISHVDSEDANPFSGAETFKQDTWTKITAYVNYHTGNFIVWQDGAPVTQASFVRPGTTLCHVRIGAYVSGDTNQARVLVDDPTIWKLEADLGSPDAAPCMANN